MVNMIRVTKQQFAQTMMEHFKLIGQGYPQRMQYTIRKKWEENFQDVTDAGFLLVDKNALLKVKTDLEDILDSELMKNAEKFFGSYVRDRWSGQLGLVLELLSDEEKKRVHAEVRRAI